MTPADLERFMQTSGIPGELLILDVPTPTVETAAQAVGAGVDQIVKSLLLVVGGEPVLAIACGTRRIDNRKLADHFGVGRRQIKFADSETVERVTGYPAGGVPPFGHPAPIRTLIDPQVLAQAFVYAGGGDDRSLVRVAPEAIRRATNATPVEILES